MQRKRGDFFRDVLADELGCPPHTLRSCPRGCPFADAFDEADYAACWDEVERRQRG